MAERIRTGTTGDHGGRISVLEASVRAIHGEIDELKTDFASFAKEVRVSIADMARASAEQIRPQWQVIFGAVTLTLAIGGAIASGYYLWMSDRSRLTEAALGNLDLVLQREIAQGDSAIRAVLDEREERHFNLLHRVERLEAVELAR